MAPEGPRIKNSEPPDVSFNSVSPSYFETMGMSLVSGETFTNIRLEGAPKTTPAIVNEVFVRRFFPNTNPIGQHFGPPGHQDGFRIQGVVSSAKLRSLREPMQPIFYEDETHSQNDRIVFYVRSSIKPEALIEPVRKVFAALDPRLPVTDVETLAEDLDASTADEMLNARLATAFAAFAAVLAGLGVYGLMALIAEHRRHELAIYFAVGAPRSSVVRLVLRQFGVAVTAGIAVGLCAVLLVGPSVQSLLYGVSPISADSMLVPLLGILTIACMGALLPLLRIVRIEPAAALRQES